MHYAVIDLGTNTFHLLVVKPSGKSFEEVYRKRVFVNIAEEGIETIGEQSYERGIRTLQDFHKVLQEFDNVKVQTFGTSALRTASNGLQFQREVKDKTGITIQIIDGRREAELISKGTKAIVDTVTGNFLIMDIGGGSVEFILIEDNVDIYVQSFPVGITALYNQFPHEEPIKELSLNKIHDHLNSMLHPLKSQLKDRVIDGLIGASGSYEVLEKILTDSISKESSSKFQIEQITTEMDKIIAQNLSQRLANENIPKQRAKLIVIAFVLIKYILNLSKFKSLIISPYALKEGAFIEMLNLD